VCGARPPPRPPAAALSKRKAWCERVTIRRTAELDFRRTSSPGDAQGGRSQSAGGPSSNLRAARSAAFRLVTPGAMRFAAGRRKLLLLACKAPSARAVGPPIDGVPALKFSSSIPGGAPETVTYKSFSTQIRDNSLPSQDAGPTAPNAAYVVQEAQGSQARSTAGRPFIPSAIKTVFVLPQPRPSIVPWW